MTEGRKCYWLSSGCLHLQQSFFHPKSTWKWDYSICKFHEATVIIHILHQAVCKCTLLLHRQMCSVFPELLIPRHRAINMFLESYSRKWLESIEDHTPTALCNELLDHQDYLVSHKSSSLPPNHRDPLTQLFTMIKRKATAGEWLVYIPLFY